MLIRDIDLYHVAMPLKEPWLTGCGQEDVIHSIIVRMRVGEHDGWAETTPHRLPFYSAEWAGGAYILLRDYLAPLLLGENIADAKALQQRLAGIKGNPFAKAGLDVAWWDAFAKSQKLPLWQLIGGKSPTVVVGADIGIKPSIDELLADIDKINKEGFQRVKLKCRPGWDVDMIRAVRESFSDLTIHVDCNSSFSIKDIDLFKKFDRFELAMIEQPLGHEDLVDHATLQQAIETPICLDESINSIDRTRHAIDLKSCRWINIKVGRVGGLTNALAIHKLCENHDIGNWIGGMLESGVGQGPSLALATLSNMKYPSDIFTSSRFYEQDLAEAELSLSEDPGISVPSIVAPMAYGHGFKPNVHRLAQFCIEKASIKIPRQ